MRRMTLAVLLMVGLAGSVSFAQLQHPVVTAARDLIRAGEHDAAIAMLRGALVSRPGNDELTQELTSALGAKREDLMRQVGEISRELTELRGRSSIRGAAGLTAPAEACEPGAVPVRVGGNIRTPMKIRDVKPEYPALAREGRVTGIVIAEAHIGCDGRVTEARVVRGQPLLNEAALDAVRQWRYTPTRRDGQPVPVIMTVTVSFTLQN